MSINNRLINVGGITRYEIGEFVEGGVVFYTTNEYSLICSLTNASPATSVWGTWGVLLGVTSESIGTGDTNTQNILAADSLRPIGASICDAFSSGGYNDWFLPSRGALFQMNRQVGNDTARGSGLGNIANIDFATHWSSSESPIVNGRYAYTLNMIPNEDYTYAVAKDQNYHKLRPIRKVLY